MIALWSVFASFAACGLAGIAAGVFLAVGDNGLTGVTMIGAGMACAGLSVFRMQSGNKRFDEPYKEACNPGEDLLYS